MNILSKPMKREEIIEKKDDVNYVEGIVEVSLSEVINRDLEQFLDHISELLVGRPTLMDTHYSIMHSPYLNPDEDTLILKVSGDASDIIDNE